jgi:hypothetical protein
MPKKPFPDRKPSIEAPMPAAMVAPTASAPLAEPDLGATEPAFGMLPAAPGAGPAAETALAVVAAAEAATETAAAIVTKAAPPAAAATPPALPVPAASLPTASLPPALPTAWPLLAAMIGISRPFGETLAKTGGAYLDAYLDWQREASQFLDGQLEQSRAARSRLAACHTIAEVASVQRDWSAAISNACLDEAMRLPAIGAKFWSIASRS